MLYYAIESGDAPGLDQSLHGEILHLFNLLTTLLRVR
jgi:hypothetical protein